MVAFGGFLAGFGGTGQTVDIGTSHRIAFGLSERNHHSYQIGVSQQWLRRARKYGIAYGKEMFV